MRRSTKSMKETLLDAGVLQKGDFTFASGKEANNKVNIDVLWNKRRILRRVLQDLGGLAMQYKPDLLVGVPEGGQCLAFALADSRYFHVSAARLRKVPAAQPGEKRFDYAFPLSKQYVEQAERIVIVEDVLNARTSTHAVLKLGEIADRAVGVVCVWDRGLPEEFEPLPDTLPVRALHQEPLPLQLDPKSYLMQRATEPRENRRI